MPAKECVILARTEGVVIWTPSVKILGQACKLCIFDNSISHLNNSTPTIPLKMSNFPFWFVSSKMTYLSLLYSLSRFPLNTQNKTAWNSVPPKKGVVIFLVTEEVLFNLDKFKTKVLKTRLWSLCAWSCLVLPPSVIRSLISWQHGF